MSIAAEQDRQARQRTGKVSIRLETALAAMIVAAFAARLHLVFAFEVNWDEFLFLSLVHEFARGDLARVLQTAHVHLFGWLPRVSGNEVDQVVAGRLVVYGFGVATAWLLHGIFRQFMAGRAALFAVLCYASFSFVLQHAASFRADGIVTALLVGAIYLVLLRRSFPAAATAGILIGLAGMVTIKAAFYLPTIAALLVCQVVLAPRPLPALARAALTVAVAMLAFAGAYALHRFSLGEVSGPDPGRMLARSYQRTIEQPGLLPQWRILVHAALMNAAILAALLVGLAAALARAATARGEARVRMLMLLSLAVPLATLLFYRNSFPYYYVFMLAPASVLCGVAADALPWRRNRERATAIFVAVLIAIGAGAAANYVKAAARGTEAQRAMLAAVHRVFPDPVAYIDRCSMVSSFPKAGFFMSSWGMLNYYEAGVPVMRQTIAEMQPRFLLGNIEALDLENLGDDEVGPDHYRLFADDVAVLKENFVHHWGIIYVAGKSFALAGGGAADAFEILIPGPYTLEGGVAVSIDGETVRPGQAVILAAGPHRIAAAGPGGRATLRWGENLYRPPVPPPDGPAFQGF